jgi:antitoxin ParD1/3/4
MNVKLAPQHEELIRQKVETGNYADASEVVSEALRLLDERDRHQRLLDALASGLAQLERGEGIEVTPEFWEELDREVDERLLRGDMPNPDVCP